MGEYEDLVARLKDEGLEDLAGEFDKFSNQSMRQRVGRTAELEKRNTELEAEVKGLKDAPKREAALRAAHVDVSKLSPAEQEIINARTADEYDEDWAKGLVERYKLPVSEVEEGEEEEPKAKVFTQPPQTGGVKSGTLKPEDVNNWPVSKRMAFREWCDKSDKNEVWEALMRGETVTGITFPG